MRRSSFSNSSLKSGSYGLMVAVSSGLILQICLIMVLVLQQRVTGLFPAILGKIGKKMIHLTTKLGEINNIEYNQGSKIYPQNQVILDCIMPVIPLKHKCLSIILISIQVVVVSKKSKKKKKKRFFFFFFFFTFLNWENRHGIGEKGGYFRLGKGLKFGS